MWISASAFLFLVQAVWHHTFVSTDKILWSKAPQLQGCPKDLGRSFMTMSNIWGHVCYATSDQDIYLRHTVIPSTEQVGILPTNTKQCMNVYLGVLSLFSLTSFPIHFFLFGRSPCPSPVIGCYQRKKTTYKRQPIRTNIVKLSLPVLK